MDAKPQDLGVVVVGVGYLGRQRAAAAVAAHGTRLVAVTDRDPKRADAVARRFGARAVKNLAAALELPGVDAVVIATPPSDHVESAHQALDAYKHVLCEKPLAIDPDDARSLALHADEAGVRLATGHNHRYYAPVRDAYHLVANGCIGRLESMRIQIGHMASAAFLGGWHTDLAVSGGGTLMDNGPHACDLIRRFLGEVVAGYGYVRNALDLPLGCESEAYATFRDQDRGIAELRSSWSLEQGYLSVELRGSRGYLNVETAPWRLCGRLFDGRLLDNRYLLQRAQEIVFRRRFGCQQSLVRELEAFVSHDPSISRSGANGWDGCRAVEMIAAVYESARSGLEASLRPPTMRTPHVLAASVQKGVA
jgi:predicted dehydrogenase